jgi:hypothetical protein
MHWKSNNTFISAIHQLDDTLQGDKAENIPRNLTNNMIKGDSMSKAEGQNISRKQSKVTEIDSSKEKHMSQMERILLKYFPIQSADEMEIPSTDAREPRIPHIIHQIWCDENIPEPYRGFIETFINQNPKWQYRFWTYESGRKLIKDRFSYILPAFDLFKKCDATHFDMIKYAVLYEFGGVYTDFDMENIRPLDKATYKYACMIPMKPYEEWVMIHSLKDDLFLSLDDFQPPPQLTTDIMLCRPKHPFFKLLLSNLLSAAPTTERDPDQISGATYVMETYIAYNGLTFENVTKHDTNHPSNTPNFYQGTRKEGDIDAVYIPNSQYFYDSVDPIYTKDGNLNKCWKFDEIEQMPGQIKHACAEFERRRTVRKNRKYTFTVHHNHHSKMYDFDRWVNSLEKINIIQVVPGRILYN